MQGWTDDDECLVRDWERVRVGGEKEIERRGSKMA